MTYFTIHKHKIPTLVIKFIMAQTSICPFHQTPRKRRTSTSSASPITAPILHIYTHILHPLMLACTTQSTARDKLTCRKWGGRRPRGMTEDQGASRDGARVYGARRAEGFSREEVGDFSARLPDVEGSAGPEHHSSATGRPERRSRLGQAPRWTTRTSCTAGRTPSR
jgi:hypothetical protein